MKSVCILVVEDHPDTLNLLKLVLQGEGFYVAGAEDGEKALDLLGEFRPAVILTDLMMPRVSGLELIQRVRESPELADIPIVVMSADRNGHLPAAAAAGANATIKKPLDFDRLVELLTQYIPVRAPMSEQEGG